MRQGSESALIIEGTCAGLEGCLEDLKRVDGFT